MKIKEIFSKIGGFIRDFASNEESILENSDLISLKGIESLENNYRENLKYKKPKKDKSSGSTHKPEDNKQNVDKSQNNTMSESKNNTPSSK